MNDEYDKQIAFMKQVAAQESIDRPSLVGAFKGPYVGPVATQSTISDRVMFLEAELKNTKETLEHLAKEVFSRLGALEIKLG